MHTRRNNPLQTMIWLISILIPWESLIAMLPFKPSCTVSENTTCSLRYTNDFVVLCLFLAATKQLYKWYFLSVRPSVTHFSLCYLHRIIMKFSGVITNDQSKVFAKGQGQRSKVKVTEVKTQLNRFRTVTPVWIHIWWWNYAHSLMLLRRGAV